MVEPPEEPKTPPLTPPFMVAAVLIAAVYVYLMYHWMRGLPAWGMEGDGLRNVTYLLLAVFALVLSAGVWVARRAQRAKPREA